MSDLQATIEAAFERRNEFTPGSVPADVREAVDTVIGELDQGRLRVAEKRDGGWQVNEWAKKAVLLSFRITDTRPVDGGFTQYFDKVPSKYAGWDAERFAKGGARVVPPAVVRRGAHIASGVVLMPSYVNIGAYVDSGTMVDTWATVGSCAQIGRNVHLYGGVGIGERGAVVSMGVYIGQSTRIYDRERDQILYGRVPAGSVVVSGSLPAENGKYSLYCAVIVKRVDAKTRAKVGINELLRSL